MPLHVLSHPLGTHVLTHLRDKTTKPALFRTLSYQISLLLALEAFKGRVFAKPLAVVPILRAGLGMVQPFQDIFPDVSVGYVGLERDHTTAIARSYYCKLPPLADKRTIVVDPMLATGGSAAQALDVVKAAGAKDVVFVCIVAAPEGVAVVTQAHPTVPIYAGSLDRQLNDRKYILPGLGDFGDRLYGT